MSHRSTFVNQLDFLTDQIDATLVTLPSVQYVNQDVVDQKRTHEYQNVEQIDEEEPRFLTTSDLMSYAFQCSQGMKYLESRRVRRMILNFTLL